MPGAMENKMTDAARARQSLKAGLVSMEDNLKQREAKVREILLSEVDKVINSVLKDDMQLVSEMKIKGESALHKIDELCSVSDDEIDPESFHTLAEDMRSIRLDVNPVALGSAFSAVKNAFMMKGMGGMNAKQFSLDIPTFEDDDFIEILILRGDASPKFSMQVLDMVSITMECQVPGNPSTVIQLGSAGSRVSKAKGFVSEDENTVSINIRKPNNIIARISASVFGSHIVNSPAILQFHHDECKDPTEHNLTVANDALGVSVVNLTLADMTSIIEEENLGLDVVSDDDFVDESYFQPDTESCFGPPVISPCSVETIIEEKNLEQIWEVVSDNDFGDESFSEPDTEFCFGLPVSGSCSKDLVERRIR